MDRQEAQALYAQAVAKEREDYLKQRLSGQYQLSDGWSYEKMADQVIATEELLREWIFEKQKAEALFVLAGDKEIGFALFFHNFSTFLGRTGIYLGDLYVLPDYRNKGYLFVHRSACCH